MSTDINRYRKQRIHKKRLKERYMKTWYFGNSGVGHMSWRHFVAINGEKYPSSLKYWKRYYLSGARGYVKHMTNSKLRSSFKRALAASNDFEDACLPQNAEYQKVEDYDWNVW